METCEELARRIQRGEPEAESVLVERFGGAVRNVHGSTRVDATTLEDLHQDTFRIAIERVRAGRLREPSKLAAFVLSLARKLAIEHFRELRSADGCEPEEELPAPEPDPLEDLLRTERAEVVRRVLEHMTCERDREVLSRLYIAGDDKDAICRDLGLSSAHFNRVLFRARERYRDLYRAAVDAAR
jgi:RNA polymerase sigma-70 factor (ECF subfamily)